MIGLDSFSAHKYWKNFDDKNVYKSIVAMESVEHWTSGDRLELDEALVRLGFSIRSFGKFRIEYGDDYIRVISRLKAPIALAVMQVIDNVSPGSAYDLLAYAAGESSKKDSKVMEESRLLIDRNVAFERLRLVSRIFAKERFDIVSRALYQRS